jgi:hypothetical protein
MEELDFYDQGLHELKQTELKELNGGNPIINFLVNFIKECAIDYAFSPDRGSYFNHPSAPQNPNGMYICVSDNA